MASTDTPSTDTGKHVHTLQKMLTHYQQLLSDETLRAASYKAQLDIALETLAAVPDGQ